MLPASRSRGLQCVSNSSVALVIFVMGCLEPSACPSIQASQYAWNGREPSMTGSQLGKPEPAESQAPLGFLVPFFPCRAVFLLCLLRGRP